MGVADTRGLVGADARLVELPCPQQQPADAYLDIHVLGAQVGAPDQLPQAAGNIAALEEGVTEAEVSVGQPAQ